MDCPAFTPKTDIAMPFVEEHQRPFLKKAYVQTWGCQMNAADSERMIALLGTRNYRLTPEPAEADLILLNTCHIREKARHKVVSRLGEFRPLKRERPDLIIAVAGCVAQAESEALAKEVPFLDLVFGPDQVEELPALLEKVLLANEARDPAFKPSGPLIDAKFSADPGYSIPIDVVPPYLDPAERQVSKFVNIVKGCNNFCTFCVVPFTRGREKSRAKSEVLDEARYFAARGVAELTLLGQNVNSYGLDEVEAQTPTKRGCAPARLPFADLLYEVAAIEGIERIRFTTSNPHDFTPELAGAFRDLPKLSNHFHLPVQSGSDRILKAMNRQYDIARYFEKVEWIRAVRPEIAFSTDLIVGFPGETDADFDATLRLMETMRYSFVYAFQYSPRRGTPAARMPNQVPEEVKVRRLHALQELQRAETERQHAAEIGRERQVLILYKNQKQEGTWYGRSDEGRLVKVFSEADICGKILPVRITDANVTALSGRLVN